MMGGSGEQQNGGPDLAAGVPLAGLEEGRPLSGRVNDEAVVLVRVAAEVFAVGATCTHYGGPLAEGIVTGETIRCPWHHACFSLRSGAAVAAPALTGLARWRTEVRDGVVYVTVRAEDEARPQPRGGPESVVIIGAGAAGHAAAETLRGEGYAGRVVVIDPDPDAPYDRPNLSKDYLAGDAPEEWIPLRPPEFYGEHGIDRIVARATALDPSARTITLEGGTTLGYGALLLATGAAPVRPPLGGVAQAHVHVLRSFADCRGVMSAAMTAQRAVIAGASFIGLEAAAALRNWGIDVTVVAPEHVPFERVLGRQVGEAVQAVHEAHGVRFRLGRTLRDIGASEVTLDDGTRIPADLVLLGVGVRPVLDLVGGAGIAVDNGVLVDSRLQTSEAGIYAAGDIARYPDPLTGESIRVEHWVVAQRQGQTAARNMLGHDEPFTAVPFFWTKHYDLTIGYVGHASHWTHLDIDGSPAAGDCRVTYRDGETTLAVATINRDQESLRAEVALEQAMARAARSRAARSVMAQQGVV